MIFSPSMARPRSALRESRSICSRSTQLQVYLEQSRKLLKPTKLRGFIHQFRCLYIAAQRPPLAVGGVGHHLLVPWQTMNSD